MTTAPTPEEVRALADELDGYTPFDSGNWPCHKAADMLRGLQAENEPLQGSLEAQRLISDRAIALAKELEARKPLPMSDDDRLRLRSDVARAIWDVMREHEDRCDHALEDVEPRHQVWDCADAAIKAVHGITGGSS